MNGQMETAGDLFANVLPQEWKQDKKEEEGLIAYLDHYYETSHVNIIHHFLVFNISFIRIFS
jgi:hypothetical protein